MNDLEARFEYSMFNSGWQDETPYVAVVAKPPSNQNEKIHFLGQEVFVYQVWAFYVLEWLRYRLSSCCHGD